MIPNIVQARPHGMTRWKLILHFIPVMPQGKTRSKTILDFVRVIPQEKRQKGHKSKRVYLEGHNSIAIPYELDN